MSGSERVKGIQVHRPIIYGSQARLLTEEEKATAPPGHTHKWTVFLASATSPPPPLRAASSSSDPAPVDQNYIPGGADDLTYIIKRVVFRLHETYPNPNRMCEKMPFQVSETGWGEFTVQIKITFVPEAAEKALTLTHPIKLHHWGEPIELAPTTATAATLVSGVTQSTSTTAAESGVDTAPKQETIDEGSVPAIKSESQTPAVVVTPAPTQTPAEADESRAGTEAPGGLDDTATPGGMSAGVAASQTIAAMYPVHSWQYDEIVFSDPPATLMTILEEHPPTPLPARNRRPRDQREEHDVKTGKKKTKPTASASARASLSRAGTEAATPGVGVGTPGPAQPVGVPGELGSADVPLEFSAEMEKGEWNRLNDVRIRIVEQMDRWREKLIVQEKELTRLKEEMRG